MTAVTTARSNTTQIARNSFGDATSVTNALSQRSAFTYGTFGELLTATDPMSHQTVLTYDTASRPITVKDANNKTAQITYNWRDQVTKTTQTLNGNPVTTTYGFDKDGNRTSMVDPNGHTWSWSFDPRDRLSTAVDPTNKSTVYSYDGNSNVLSRTDPLGQKVTYQYGTGDFLTLVSYYDGLGALQSQVTLTYDTNHLLAGCNDTASGAGNCTFAYDSLDRLDQVNTPNGTFSYTLDDKLNRQDGVTLPGSLGEAPISYSFDADNNMTGETQGTTSVSLCYDALDRLCQQTLGNGVTTNWSFSAAGFVSSLVSQNAGGTTLDSHSYTRDAVGNVTQEVIGGPTNFTSSFSFDDLYRVVGASDPTGSYSWGYDNNGNRLSQVQNGVTTTYSVDAAGRLTAVNGTPVTTDADGNITADANGSQYTWDARGRLTGLTTSGGTVYSFGYATNGLRTSETVNGATTNFVLEGTRCIAELSGGGQINTLFGALGPVSRNGQWFTPDGGGSIASVSDSSGNPIAQNCYGVFGQVATNNPNSGDPLQFMGGMADPTSGLDTIGPMNYSPILGRAIGEFGAGIGNCVSGTVKSLVSAVPTAGSPMLDLINRVLAFARAVQDKGIVLAVLDPITNFLQGLGDFSSARAAGNSLCNDTITAAGILGGIEGTGGGTPPDVPGPPPDGAGPSISGGGESWADKVKGIQQPGEYSTTVGSQDEAIRLIQEAKPDAVQLPDATDPTGDYPKPPPGVKNWWQIHPPGELYDPNPHIKYEDWTGGKKDSGGSWGHIDW